jgi:hypothetical protein
MLRRIVIDILLLFCAVSNFLPGAADDSIVTCGSVIKLKHKETNHHLHSHQIAWGSGSGQQSVIYSKY